MTWPNAHSLGGIPLDLQDGSRVVTRASGIDGAAPIRLGLEDRAQQDGQRDARPFYSGRVIQLEGVCEEATPVAAQELTDHLRALSRQLVQFTVNSTARGERNALVRVQAGIEPEWINDTTFTYVMTVVAPDPILYGPVAFAQVGLAGSSGGAGLPDPLTYPLDYGLAPGVTPGAVSLANAGTTSYHPRLRINGPVVSPVVTLVETGDIVSYSGTIAAGQHLDINWGEPRRVTIGDNPVPMRHKVSYTGNWLAVPVGGGSLTFSAFDADPAASLSVWSYEGAWE